VTFEPAEEDRRTVALEVVVKLFSFSLLLLLLLHCMPLQRLLMPSHHECGYHGGNDIGTKRS
jgi:hypothetical protein